MTTKRFKITGRMMRERCELYERLCTAHDKRALAAGRITQAQYTAEQAQLHKTNPTTTTSRNNELIGEKFQWDDDELVIIGTAADGIIVEKTQPTS